VDRKNLADIPPVREAPRVPQPRVDQYGLELALMDVKDVCACLRLSKSWIFGAVRQGRFPEPVIRQSRCTRWLRSDVQDWIAGHCDGARRKADSAPATPRAGGCAHESRRRP
jgi:predicted DNA-binding transcriptional regulator AlpA